MRPDRQVVYCWLISNHRMERATENRFSSSVHWRSEACCLSYSKYNVSIHLINTYQCFARWKLNRVLPKHQRRPVWVLCRSFLDVAAEVESRRANGKPEIKHLQLKTKKSYSRQIQGKVERVTPQSKRHKHYDERWKDEENNVTDGVQRHRVCPAMPWKQLTVYLNVKMQ